MATKKEKILLIEDDPAIRTGLELNLKLEGYDVVSTANAIGGLAEARTGAPDLILLDLMLPDGSGLDLLQILRREKREMQILILTARTQEEDVVKGLKLGADDYISKPFSLVELMARVEAALRRPRLNRQLTSAEELRFGPITIELTAHQVRNGEELIKLTRREYQLLCFLAKHPHRVYSREQLLQMVWGYDYEGTARTVDNFIYSLRQKLEAEPNNPVYLVTVHGIGYCFKPDG